MFTVRNLSREDGHLNSSCVPVVVDHEQAHGHHGQDEDDEQPVSYGLAGGRGGGALLAY